MTQQKSETIKTRALYRYEKLDRAGADKENRTVPLAFSSETPYERYFGTEILDHTSQSIRLGRLNDGGAVLLDHDTTRHVGVVEKVVIGTDRVGRAVVRFGKSAEAESAFQDVQDGIRQHVSVGYFIHRMVMEETKDGAETYRVTDWEPIEISLVAIPADPTVGIGREADPEVSTVVVRTVADDPTPPQPEIIIMTDVKIKEPAELERERTNALLDLGQQYAKYLADKDVGDAIRNGRSVDQFRDIIMQKMQSHHTDTSALHIGLEKKEIQRYSIARAVVAAITGDWKHAGLERAASEAVGKLLGRAPEGFYVPYDAFQRDFNVGTGSEAGNLVATELRTDLFVDVLRNNLVLAKLGIRILPGLTSTVDIPKKTVASAIGMATEIQALTETNPNTGKVTLSPKRMGGFVEYSKQSLIQSSLAIEPMLRDDLLMGLAVNIQDQVVNGSGAGANMRGIRNTSGIGSVVGGTNGLALAWTHVVGLESACANVNAEPDAYSGYLINTKARGTLKTTQKAANLPFIWDNGDQPLNGYRAAVSNTVPSNLTKGTSTTVCSSVLFGSDWSMSVLGLFGAPDITVDPYSLATTGQVRITLNHFADHQVRLAACFADMEDALTP
jgi:HK97 family phage major capsid protein